MRRLFVNADDFGLTEGVSRGILEAMAAGVVGGTTAMVCAADGPERLARLGSGIAGRVGLHLQLTGGRPCLPPEEIPSLVTEEGLFPRKKVAVANVDPDAVRREFERLLPVIRSGRYLPAMDHQTPPGTTLETYRAYARMLREYGTQACKDC